LSIFVFYQIFIKNIIIYVKGPKLVLSALCLLDGAGGLVVAQGPFDLERCLEHSLGQPPVGAGLDCSVDQLIDHELSVQRTDVHLG